MDNNPVKIKRQFLRDEVYDILQEWIVIGKLEQGEKLRDQELSDLLGISRTPIREALLRLEDDGLVVTKANRWTSVATINLEEAVEVYSIAESLECLAIEQGFQNISKSNIKQLKEANQQFKEYLEQEDKLGAFQADTIFHELFVQLSDNNELIKLLRNLKVKIQRMEIHYFSKSNNTLASYIEHEKIIQTFIDKDKIGAIEAIKENWKNSLSRMKMNLIDE